MAPMSTSEVAAANAAVAESGSSAAPASAAPPGNSTEAAQGSHEAKPDAGSISSGPGQFREFHESSRFVPEQRFELGPRARSQESVSRSRQRSDPDGFRTLDYSRLNEELHNWSRADTFQTPFGHSAKATPAPAAAACKATSSGSAPSRPATAVASAAPAPQMDPAVLLDLTYKMNRCMSSIDELQAQLHHGLDELRAQAAAQSPMARQLAELGQSLADQMARHSEAATEKQEKRATEAIAASLEVKGDVAAFRKELLPVIENRLQEVLQTSFEKRTLEALDQCSKQCEQKVEQAVQALDQRAKQCEQKLEQAVQATAQQCPSIDAIQDALKQSAERPLEAHREWLEASLQEMRGEIKELGKTSGAVDFSFVDFSMLLDDMRRLLQEHTDSLDVSSLVAPVVEQVLERVQPPMCAEVAAKVADLKIPQHVGETVQTELAVVKELTQQQQLHNNSLTSTAESLKELDAATRQLQQTLLREVIQEVGELLTCSPVLIRVEEKLKAALGQFTAGHQEIVADLHCCQTVQANNFTAMREALCRIPQASLLQVHFDAVTEEIRQLRRVLKSDSDSLAVGLQEVESCIGITTSTVLQEVKEMRADAASDAAADKQRSLLRDVLIEAKLPAQFSHLEDALKLDTNELAKLLRAQVTADREALEASRREAVEAPLLQEVHEIQRLLHSSGEAASIATESHATRISELSQQLSGLSTQTENFRNASQASSGQVMGEVDAVKKGVSTLNGLLSRGVDIDFGKLSLLLKEHSGKVELARVLDELRKIQRHLNFAARGTTPGGCTSGLSKEAHVEVVSGKDEKHFSLVLENPTRDTEVTKMDFCLHDGEELRVPINSHGQMSSGVVANRQRPASAGGVPASVLSVVEPSPRLPTDKNNGRKCGLPAQAFRVLAASPRVAS